VTPYPADFVAYVLAALPYAGMEALRIAGWCIAAVAPAAAGAWLLARARRLGGLMDDGDGQGGIPGRGRLRRAVADADRKHLPVTIVMDLGGLVHPPHGGHITDRTPTEAIDPDPALGCRYCAPPFEATAYCTCATACGDPWCGYLQWLQAGRGAGHADPS
jgi:hypothetical protein